MKYYYLFILIAFLIVGLGSTSIREKSELNKEQGKQIESLIITSQYEEKGVANKINGLMINTPYYIRRLCNETTPMVESDQFVMPVLKYGIPGKEPEYADDNESPRLRLHTSENRKAVILNRLKKIGNRLGRKKGLSSRKRITLNSKD